MSLFWHTLYLYQIEICALHDNDEIVRVKLRLITQCKLTHVNFMYRIRYGFVQFTDEDEQLQQIRGLGTDIAVVSLSLLTSSISKKNHKSAFMS